MGRAEFVRRTVEIDEVSAPDVDGTDTEPQRAGIDEIEIDKALKGMTQCRSVVPAGGGGAAWRGEKRRRQPRREESRRPSHDGRLCARLIDGAARGKPFSETSTIVGQPAPNRIGAHRCPEFTQSSDTSLWSIANYDRSIDRTYRNAGNPIGTDASFVKRLINTRLIGAKRATALQR